MSPLMTSVCLQPYKYHRVPVSVPLIGPSIFSCVFPCSTCFTACFIWISGTLANVKLKKPSCAGDLASPAAFRTPRPSHGEKPQPASRTERAEPGRPGQQPAGRQADTSVGPSWVWSATRCVREPSSKEPGGPDTETCPARLQHEPHKWILFRFSGYWGYLLCSKS